MSPVRSWTLLVAALLGVACGDEARVLGPLDEEESAQQVESSNNPLDTAAAGEGGSSGRAEQPPSGAEMLPENSEPGASGAPPPDDGNVSPPPALPQRPLRGPCDLATRIGGFSVEAQADFGVVQGVVADAVLPAAVPRLVSETGSCRLLQRRNLACLPACAGNEACGEAGSCIPYPRQIDVGVVEIAGLTRTTSMSPLEPGNTYFSPGADNPPYSSDAQVLLTAAGGSGIEPFELLGRGSEPLPESPSGQLVRGMDLSLSWPPPGTQAPTHVLVELTIDQHGVSPLTLACELADSGSGTLPAALIDQLLDAGISGFPNGKLTRRTADHVLLAQGCVELMVGSPRAANVTVAGYTPCNGSAECPDGQSCNTSLQRCE